MEIALRRNIQPHATLRFFVDADLSRFALRPQHVTVAVHVHPLDEPQGIVRELYTADLAGFRLQAGNINNIVQMVRKLLPALVNYARLPDYVFIARRSQRIYPVYTIGDEVVATTPGGPTFRHVELAKVRRYLTDYMVRIGELGTPGKSEKLHVRGVSRATLALLRPICYLKKRIPGQPEFWAPVFEAEDGTSIYAYVVSARREASVENGGEVVLLRNVCADALIGDQRLVKSHDLRIDRLMPDYWARLRGRLTTEGLKLTVFDTDQAGDGSELPIYRDGDTLVAVETRTAEARYGLFFGQDAPAVRDRVAEDFVRRRLISSVDAVRIVPAPTAQRATSVLDAVLQTSNAALSDRLAALSPASTSSTISYQ